MSKNMRENISSDKIFQKQNLLHSNIHVRFAIVQGMTIFAGITITDNEEDIITYAHILGIICGMPEGRHRASGKWTCHT